MRERTASGELGFAVKRGWSRAGPCSRVQTGAPVSPPKRPQRSPSSLCLCDRGAHQFQVRCSCFPEPPFTDPGGGFGKQAGSCFLVGPAVWSRRQHWRIDSVVRPRDRHPDGRRRALGTRLRCAANAGRALERDPSLSGEGGPKHHQCGRAAAALCLLTPMSRKTTAAPSGEDYWRAGSSRKRSNRLATRSSSIGS